MFILVGFVTPYLWTKIHTSFALSFEILYYSMSGREVISNVGMAQFQLSILYQIKDQRNVKAFQL